MFKFLLKPFMNSELRDINTQGLNVYHANVSIFKLGLEKKMTMGDVRECGQDMINFTLSMQNLNQPVCIMNDFLGEIILSVDKNNQLTVKQKPTKFI